MRFFATVVCVCLFTLAAWAGAKSDPATGQTSDGLGVSEITFPQISLPEVQDADMDALQLELDGLYAEAEILKYAGRDDAAVWSRIYEIQNLLEPRTEDGALDEGGETCETAVIIPSLPYCDTGNTSNNLNDYVPPSGTDCSPSPPGGSGRDVVYYYDPEPGELVSVSLCGSSFDTYVHIYEESFGQLCPSNFPLNQVGCNDDHNGACPVGSGILTSCAHFGSNHGFPVYIIVDGWRSVSHGAYQIHVTSGTICEPCPAAPTGRCCYTQDSGAPGCQSDVNEAWCDQRNGDWVEGASCTSDPCPPPPPCVECPTDAYISIEPVCYDGYVDQTNSNCGPNDEIWVEDVSCNSTICGTGGSYLSPTGLPHNDNDWFRLNVASAEDSVFICFKGGHAGAWALYRITGPNPCSGDNAFVANGTFPACQTVCNARCLEPGEYWLGVVFANGTPCGTPYRIDIQCLWCGNEPTGRCCYTSPNGEFCSDGLTAAACADLAGDWLEGASCTSAPCTPPTGRCCYVTSAAGPSCEDGVTREWCAAVQGQWAEGETCESACCVTDYCAWPIVVPGVLQYTNTENTCCATDVLWEISDLNCGFNTFPAGGTIIYKIVLEEPGTLDISVSGPTDNQLMIFTDCNDPQGTCVASSDIATDNVGNIYQGATEQLLGLTLPAGTYFVATATYIWSGNPCGPITLTIVSDTPLPAELTSFDAVAGNETVTLSWTTASEFDLSHFNLLRNGVLVAEVPAQNSASGNDYVWTDDGVTNGTSYQYSLVSVDIDGVSNALGTESATPTASDVVVTEYALHQNYPNPFNPETSISFDLVENGVVNLTVYNALGQSVAVLVDGMQTAGRHTVSFDGSALTSGLYFYRLEAGDFTAIHKMVLMK